MKFKFVILAMLAQSFTCFGQGTVNFNNNISVGGDHLVYLDIPLGSNPVVGTNYVAELYYGPLGTPESSLIPLASSLSHFRITSTTSPGTWSGKTVTLPIGGVNIPISVEVKVWDITLFPTWEEEYQAWLPPKYGGGRFGASGVFTYTEVSSRPPLTTDTQMVTMPAFTLQWIPEPTALSLSLVGVSGLLLRGARRRH